MLSVTYSSNDSVSGLDHTLMLDWWFGQYIVNCMGHGRKWLWLREGIRPEGLEKITKTCQFNPSLGNDVCVTNCVDQSVSLSPSLYVC